MKRIFSIIMVALVMAAVMVVMAAPAFAKITPAQPASCENKSGAMPGGQQPECKGGGLKQNEAQPAKNPAGNAPPGQNK